MRNRSLWWLHPAWTVGGFTGLVVVASHLLSPLTYLNNWHTPKFLDGSSFLLMALCVLLFVGGSVLADLPGRNTVRREVLPERPLDQPLLRKLFLVSYGLTLFGYLVWAAVAVGRGLSLGIIVQLLRGQNGVAYIMQDRYLGNIKGITTCTQFGIATVVLAVLIGVRPTRRQWLFLAGPFVLLTLIRVLLNSERLALIEVAVPALVLLVQRLNLSSSKRWVQGTLRVAPVAGFGALFASFSIFEYFRSWVTFYSGQGVSFFEFAGSRLLGYYATALNNGTCLFRYLSEPLHMPLTTLAFLWQAPIIKDLLLSWFPNAFTIDDYYGMLSREANPEFNNGGGLLAPMVDLGVPAGLLYWLLAGLVCGILYRLFRAGNAWGLCLYPFVYITLLEIPRGLHWCSPRSTPGFCFLLLSAILLRIRQTRAAAAETNPETAIEQHTLPALV
jgi:oligosaccharide repeat unit polymerase